MRELYKKFEAERDELNMLVVQAREKEQSIATDDTIITQSRKVDEIVETLNCNISLVRVKVNE